MRISDWSSDVCSSDLRSAVRNPADLTFSEQHVAIQQAIGVERGAHAAHRLHFPGRLVLGQEFPLETTNAMFRGQCTAKLLDDAIEIGRASCRERVCQYV